MGGERMNELKYKELIDAEKMKEEYQKFNPVHKFLESCNLKVWREVIPDQCLTWEHPYRVDLIFEIPNYGLIAIEGKNLNTQGQGSKYAAAYLQIRDKYKDKTYFGGKFVRRWCVFGMTHSDMGGERAECFVKHFLNKLGISYFQFCRYNWKESIVIDAMTQNRIDIDMGNTSGIPTFSGIDKDNRMDYGKLIQ